MTGFLALCGAECAVPSAAQSHGGQRRGGAQLDRVRACRLRRPRRLWWCRRIRPRRAFHAGGGDQHQALDAIERREGAGRGHPAEHSRITRRNLLAAVRASQVQACPVYS